MYRKKLLTILIVFPTLSLLTQTAVVHPTDQSNEPVVANVIGQPGGTLGKELMRQLKNVKDANPKAVVIGEGQWSQADRSALQRHFKAGLPIALINANADTIGELRRVLDLPGAAILPEGVKNLEAYAVDKAVDGKQYELIVVPAGNLPKARVLTYSGNQASGKIESKREEDAPFLDTKQLQAARQREVINWLQQDPGRDNAAVIRKSKAVLADSEFKDLEQTVNSTESRMVFTFRQNIHTLTTNVWSVHNATLNEDWFLVRQNGQFSATNELLPMALVNNISNLEGNDRGRFTEYYYVNAFVPGLTNNEAVWTDRTSPETTSGVDKVSSTVSWNLSGKLSGNVSGTAGGEIGVGVSVNNSISFDIPDVTASNRSGSQQNNASWEYAINGPAWTDGFGCIGHSGLMQLKPMSAGTFQPVMQWIWRVRPAARVLAPKGLPIEVRFKTRVRHIYYGPGCSFNMTDWTQASSEQSATLTVPWPSH